MLDIQELDQTRHKFLLFKRSETRTNDTRTTLTKQIITNNIKSTNKVDTRTNERRA